MNKEKWETIFDGIDCEGFDYYFRYHGIPDDIDDVTLLELIKAYESTAKKLEKYINIKRQEYEVQE